MKTALLALLALSAVPLLALTPAEREIVLSMKGVIAALQTDLAKADASNRKALADLASADAELQALETLLDKAEIEGAALVAQVREAWDYNESQRATFAKRETHLDNARKFWKRWALVFGGVVLVEVLAVGAFFAIKIWKPL